MSAPAGIWAEVARAARRPPAGTVDLWAGLRSIVDPAELRPELRADVEIREFPLRWGNDYAIVANPRDLLHYRLEPQEVWLLRQMDGSRSLKEIVVERLRESGDLDLETVADLTRQLKVGGFLETPYVDTYAAVERALHPISRLRRRAREFVRTLSVDWAAAHGFVRWLYDHGVRWLFRPWAQVPAAAAAILGLGAFVLVYRSGRFSLTDGSAAVASLILLGLNYLLTFVHELGHASVLVHYGRRIKSAGFMIYFGSPAFFVDASDGLMLDRRQRILQAFAGPYAEMILAGLASLLVWAFPEAGFAPVLYKFALLNYFVLFLNLIPLLELDGYWILSDVIQVPDLRPRSLAFVRHDLWRKLARRERFAKQEVGLALYGLIGVVFTVFSLWVGAFFWVAVFGGLVETLWAGGIVTRVLLVALGLFLAGPALRGMVALLRATARRVRAVARRVRFRLETRWRVEAAELIDALPSIPDLPGDVLNDLAGRVRLRSVGRGEPVVRQGERPDAFYVVREGTLQVVEEPPGEDIRVIGTLGRGGSFGELGLIEGVPRRATVRAVTEAELFQVDKGTFDRLLADAIEAPGFAPTVQELVELSELPAFAHLEMDRLAEVLEHGTWVNVPPGETILREGEPGDAFFAIRSGRAEVLRGGEPVGSLGPGEHFGEVALLLDVPRTASVRAVTPMRAFRLDRDGFDRLLVGAFRQERGPGPAIDRTWQH